MRRQLSDNHPSRSRVGVIAGVAAGLVGGAAAGLVLGVPGVSGAADAPALLVQQVDDEAPSVEAGDDVERGDRLRDVLDPLVEDGTITSDQADAVTEHLVEAAPEARWHRHGQGTGRPFRRACRSRGRVRSRHRTAWPRRGDSSG